MIYEQRHHPGYPHQRNTQYGFTTDDLRAGQSTGGTLTTYAWDWASAVPELLAQSTGSQSTPYLLGHETLGWAESGAWRTILPDALGSLRQVADAVGALVAVREWEPYGQEVGGLREGLGYTGEWQDAAVGLVYLRARWYAPGVGIFTAPDPYFCRTCFLETLHRYAYVRNNPVNATDPSGLFPWPWEWPAGLVVDLVKAAYWKVGPLRFCWLNPDDGQWPTDTVDDLFTDFVCEYGPEHRYFYADAHLTQQLARTHTIHLLRWQFYLQGGGALKGTYEFETLGFLLATLDSISEGDETRFVVRLSQLNITHFLGTFDYDIREMKGWGLLRFQIDNTTDLASGSRIPRILGGVREGWYVEELIERYPQLRNEPIGSLIRRYPIVSILKPSTREETTCLEGGGRMDQTFVWCERYPMIGICGVNIPFPSDALMKPGQMYLCP